MWKNLSNILTKPGQEKNMTEASYRHYVVKINIQMANLFKALK